MAAKPFRGDARYIAQKNIGFLLGHQPRLAEDQVLPVAVSRISGAQGYDEFVCLLALPLIPKPDANRRINLYGSRFSPMPGERVVTSGHGGVLPPRFPVGVVASVSDGGIKVQPFIRRDRLEYVRVVDFGLGGVLDSQPAPTDAAGTRRAVQ